MLCLPGLTRNGRDFHDLAVALSRHPSNARTVYTFDYRGRGLSESDPDWLNYTVTVNAYTVSNSTGNPDTTASIPMTVN